MFCFFFFKQKTAYEMRISDWSSDVCSSDLETYGPPPIRALSSASRAFLDTPPPGFAEHPLTAPRGVLLIAREDQRAALEEAEREGAADGATIRRLDAGQAMALVPVLDPGYVAGALLEPDARDMDVAAIHAGYLRLLQTGSAHV